MAVYVYQCENEECSHNWEIEMTIQKHLEVGDDDVLCPECGSKEVCRDYRGHLASFTIEGVTWEGQIYKDWRRKDRERQDAEDAKKRTVRKTFGPGTLGRGE